LGSEILRFTPDQALAAKGVGGFAGLGSFSGFLSKSKGWQDDRKSCRYSGLLNPMFKGGFYDDCRSEESGRQQILKHDEQV